MAQAQSVGTALGSRTAACDSCNVVNDLIDRTPQLLDCGHHLCLLCLRSGKRDKVIFCTACGYPTSSPRDIDALPEFRVPVAIRRTDVRETSPGHGKARPSDMANPDQDNHDGDSSAANGIDQDFTSAGQVNGGINRAGTSPVPRDAAPVAGEELQPAKNRIVLMPHSAQSIVLIRSSGDGSDDEPSEPPNSENASAAILRSWIESFLVRVSCGPTPAVYNGIAWSLHTIPRPAPSSDDAQNSQTTMVNRMKEDLLKLIQKLRIATSSDRLVSTSYLREERRNIHRSLLDLQKEETFIRPLNFMLNPPGKFRTDNEIPYSSLGVISDIKAFLGELRQSEGGTEEDAVFHLCTVLICQRYKAFLERISSPYVSQGARVISLPIQGVRLLTVSKSVADTQTQAESRGIPESSEAHEQQSESHEGAESINNAAVQKNNAVDQNNNADDQNNNADDQFSNGADQNNNAAELNSQEKWRTNKVTSVQRYIETRPDYKRLANRYGCMLNITLWDMANVYYMDFQVDGCKVGRVVIEIFPSLVPLMSANFAVLCSGTYHISYKGCKVFQCWEGQSIISGDTEFNSGAGGRSLINEDFFAPDDFSLPPERGAVGMRKIARIPRSLKGKVSSQFRILLSEQPKMTGQFGWVVSGMEVLDQISQLDDMMGNPQKRVIISDCGKLDF